MPLPGPEAASTFENAQDLAYSELRNWIFNGPLKPGEIIRDVDIAGLLGISRTPVREALIRLSQEGLIDASKGRKTRVSIPDVKRAPIFTASAAPSTALLPNGRRQSFARRTWSLCAG